MVEAAKANDRPVYAANAPRRYVRLARTDGFEKLASLMPAQQDMYDVPEAVTEGPYKDRFWEIMGGAHPTEEDESLTEEERAEKQREAEEMMLSFFRSQNVWDATMAETIWLALARGNRPVVHVVGQFHVDYEGGLVERLQNFTPTSQIVTVSVANAWSDELREEEQGKADVVVYVGPRQEE